MILVFIIAICLFLSGIIRIILGGADIGKNNYKIGEWLNKDSDK